MRMSEVRTAEQLREFMAEPAPALVEFMAALDGGVVVLGAGGKVGPDLVETIVRADSEAGVGRRVTAASRFSDARVRQRLAALPIELRAGDLGDREFLSSLPAAPNVIYMAGVKFGTSRDHRLAFHVNCIVPYLVGDRFARSRIVVFSSTNPYPAVPFGAPGAAEDVAPDPAGVYGWTVLAREAAFATTALANPGQALCCLRLAYAQHLAYGVLVDIARMVSDGEPVCLAVPSVNLISQRDAIDVAIRALGHCASPAFLLNCAGPVVPVRTIAERMAEVMGADAVFAGSEGERTMVADDSLCVSLFGPYRDGVDEMIEGAARWVMAGGESWGRPTMFGKATRDY
jgi:hypothetical protein